MGLSRAVGNHTLGVGKRDHSVVDQVDHSFDVSCVVVPACPKRGIVKEKAGVGKSIDLDSRISTMNELCNCVQPGVDSKATSRTAVDYESVSLLRWQQVENILDMLHSVVVPSE